MTDQHKSPSRRKFIGWGLATAAALSVLKFFQPSAKKETKTVKMLTQDGKLVEVNIASLPAKKKKITNTELQNWVKK
jgi:hypothetical protein